MLVSCPKCTVKLKVLDESIKPGGSRFKCAQCSTHFVVRPPKSWTEKTPSDDEKPEGYEFLSQDLDLKSSGVNLRLKESPKGGKEEEAAEAGAGEAAEEIDKGGIPEGFRYVTRVVEIAPSGEELHLKDDESEAPPEEGEMPPEEREYGGHADIEPSGEEIRLKEEPEEEPEEEASEEQEAPPGERDFGREVDIAPSGEEMRLEDEAETEIIEDVEVEEEVPPVKEGEEGTELPEQEDQQEDQQEEIPPPEGVPQEEGAMTAAPAVGAEGTAPPPTPASPEYEETEVAGLEDEVEEETVEGGKAGTSASAAGAMAKPGAPARSIRKVTYMTPITRRKDDLVQDKSFFGHIPGAFAYPFAGTAVFAIIGGTIFIWVLRVVASVSFFALIPLAIVAGYLTAFLMKIISHSASGERKLPEWPEFTDFWDDILLPIFQVCLTGLLCFSPAWAYLVSPVETSVFVLVPLLVAGIIYYPIALLGVSMTGSIMGMNPLVLVPSMLKIPADYIVACLMLGVIFVIETLLRGFLAGAVPYVGGLIDTFLALFFLFVEARLLGLMYYANRKKLGWMAVDDVEV